jgi:hypothetical protein
MKFPALFFLLTLPALCQAPSFQNEVSIKEEGNVRRIRANGIPDHAPGRFPNAHNPNTIQPQSYNYTVPVKPEKQAQPAAFRMQPFGIAVNGVVFDPFAAEWWRGDPNSGWQYEPQSGAIDLGLDEHNAHVQPNGAYHYHGIPNGLLEALAAAAKPHDAARLGRGWFSHLRPAGSHGRKRCQSPLKTMKSGHVIKSGARRPMAGPAATTTAPSCRITNGRKARETSMRATDAPASRRSSRRAPIIMCSRSSILTSRDCLRAKRTAASSVADLRVVRGAWDLARRASVRRHADAAVARDLAHRLPRLADSAKMVILLLDSAGRLRKRDAYQP